MQILHAGRYAMHPFAQSASGIKAPIAKFAPSEMSPRQIRKTIEAFANSAGLAQLAGYDGVEIMGSEGYLINQFLCKRTNMRYDEWGGTYKKRMRFAVEIVKAVRKAVGSDFIIIFRLSMLDLVEQGSTFEDVIMLAKALEDAGVRRSRAHSCFWSSGHGVDGATFPRRSAFHCQSGASEISPHQYLYWLQSSVFGQRIQG